MKKRITLINLAIVITACNPVVTTYTIDKTVILSDSEIEALDKEYRFNSLALTQNYLKKKLERWIATDGTKLIKEIEYARSKGEATVPFKALIDADSDLLPAIKLVPEVISERTRNVPFDNFLKGIDLSGIIITVTTGLNNPYGIAADNSGNIYIADSSNHRVRKVTPDGIKTLVAGVGSYGFSDGNGDATSATLHTPFGLTADGSGNVYIADSGNNMIRKVDTAGKISTYAGNGSPGHSGDGGDATDAAIKSPNDLFIDKQGNLFIVAEHIVRKIDTEGKISTIAGNGTPGYSANGVVASSGGLTNPNGIAVDTSGNVYISEQSTHRVMQVRADGKIYVFAGTGTSGFAGDGDYALQARLASPTGLGIDKNDNLYIAEYSNNRVRKVDKNGKISTVAGNGYTDYSGDNGAATLAALNRPNDVVVDNSGNIYIADTKNNRIRKVYK